MAEGIRELCALSLLFGLAMSAAPEGSVKKVMSILCSAILILSILKPLSRMDMESYAMHLAIYAQKEKELDRRGAEMKNELGRLVIERQYEAYIMDKAKEKSLPLDGVSVKVQRSTEGLWLPYSVSLSGELGETEKQILIQLILSDLGIPKERQMWTGREGQEDVALPA